MTRADEGTDLANAGDSCQTLPSKSQSQQRGSGGHPGVTLLRRTKKNAFA